MNHAAFKSSIYAWGEEAISQLQHNLDTAIEFHQRPFWTADDDENIQQRYINISWNFRELSDLLHNLPEWKAVEDALAQDDVLRGRFGRSIGTFLGGRSWQLPDWAQSLIPSPHFDRAGKTILVPTVADFKKRADEHIRVLISSEVTIDTVWPIIGLECAEEVIELEAGVTLRRLTPIECAWAFQSSGKSAVLWLSCL
jgi:hypothetical protein